MNRGNHPLSGDLSLFSVLSTMIMEVVEDSETDQKDNCSEKITGHVQKGITECTISSWYEMLDSFIHEWWNDPKEKPVQFFVWNNRFLLNGKSGQKTKQCIFKEVSKFAYKMMKYIKWDTDTDAGKTGKKEFCNGPGFGG